MLRSLFNNGEDGVLYDFSTLVPSSMYLDIAGTKKVYGGNLPVGYVEDTKGVGVPYPASAASDAARRVWNENYWKYLNPAFRGQELSVTLPDLGSDCSIVIVTPAGVSIQIGQSISGAITLPAYALRIYCIVDRALTDREITSILADYGGDYAINYDATIAARSKSGTTYHTDTDLGWTPNTDVGASGEVQELINSLVDGDEVIFDAMYKVSGHYDLSALQNITFRAATKQACGMNCLDGILELAENNSLPEDNSPVFTVGEGFLVDGFYCTQDTIDVMHEGMWGGGGKGGWFAAYDKSSFYATDCKFDTKGWHFFEFENVANAVIARSIIKDGKYCIHLGYASDNLIVAHNYFTGGYGAPKLGGIGMNGFYDGIKTFGPCCRGPRNMVFVENVAEDIKRDVIDTTGGIMGTLISANVLRNFEITSLDLKSMYQKSLDVANGPIENVDVKASYNLYGELIGPAMVFTTIWEAPETPNPDFAAGPMTSYRNHYNSEGAAPFLVKSSKGVLSCEDTFTGEIGLISAEYDVDTPGFLVSSIVERKYDRSHN